MLNMISLRLISSFLCKKNKSKHYYCLQVDKSKISIGNRREERTCEEIGEV